MINKKITMLSFMGGLGSGNPLLTPQQRAKVKGGVQKEMKLVTCRKVGPLLIKKEKLGTKLAPIRPSGKNLGGKGEKKVPHPTLFG